MLERRPGEWGDGLEHVAVSGHGEVSLPAQTVLAALQQPGAEACLDAPVPHAADVGRDEVRQIAERRYRDGEEQVAGLLIVPVDGPGEPLIGKPEIEADVVGLGLLPLDVRIHRAGTAGRDEGVAELILRQVVAQLIGGVLQVVPERLVAGLGPRAPELQVGQGRDAPQERLLRQAPRERTPRGRCRSRSPDPNRDEPSRRTLAARMYLSLML